ncbi:hypothetical protein O9H85_08270 [Paenibacillus filicis]|uniref:Uncharacterized protein n=1 Tax=Paenibacillus gyeongsangnamensis TaxID=3388067 RepID=A0ABT4Q6I2_9BACL|nr:hypothetical protein [Paenibacillus filicis]MCZ8512428.1 hypothetical protein [Paenibacillus filicis]
MKLNKTQKQVLKVLYEFKTEWLSPDEIKSKSKEFISLPNISSALNKFANDDLVYQPIIENGTYKFQISPEGESEYLNQI